MLLAASLDVVVLCWGVNGVGDAEVKRGGTGVDIGPLEQVSVIRNDDIVAAACNNEVLKTWY